MADVTSDLQADPLLAMQERRLVSTIVRYASLTAVGLVMLYPLV